MSFLCDSLVQYLFVIELLLISFCLPVDISSELLITRHEKLNELWVSDSININMGRQRSSESNMNLFIRELQVKVRAKQIFEELDW